MKPIHATLQTVFLMASIIMVLIWIAKVGFFSGIGYGLAFSFIKRGTIRWATSSTQPELLESDEAFVKRLMDRTVEALIVVHVIQAVLLIIMTANFPLTI